MLELKRVGRHETLESALESAAEQLRGRDYGAELRSRGARPLSQYAVAFDGKQVGVRVV